MRNAYGEATYATAAEVSRNFGRWQDQALAGPVVVTHHGRPRVVVVSAQQYDVMLEAHTSESGTGGDSLEELQAAVQAYRSATGGGSIRLSRRGIVSSIDEPLAVGLGIVPGEAMGAAMTELVAVGDRRRLTSALEACFDAATALRLDVTLLGRGETQAAVSLGLAPLLKDGQVDGVIVAVTRAAPGDAVEKW